MITVRSFVFNELGVNSFVVYDETGQCIIVDPGCNNQDQYEELRNFISSRSLEPVYIVNTHGHFDHVAGNAWAKSEFGCPLLIHKDDMYQLQHAGRFAGIFGLTVESSPGPDRFITEGENLNFGNSAFQVLHVPGHSPGSICLYSAGDALLICGDVLFNGSIGRTDLFGGDHELLISGIHEKLMVLPRETKVWPGHGPATTIGHEYDTNPFLR
ncbi:MAG TPA: MBL fold metallo-hydrolase [Bacteroidales bacterium]|nr:MBL fold metallo-hydrolase [Bacteroidales bacterium]